MSDIITRALEFAAKAHGDQKRKYTGEPYINHPIAVADLVFVAGYNHKVVAAAILHDTVEDTPVTLRDIQKDFGIEVADIVYWLTEPEVEGNRAFRKAAYAKQLSLARFEAKSIKLADLIDNTKSIVQHDPEFARVYLGEKAVLLEVLRTGDLRLYLLAERYLKAGLAQLGASV